MVNYTLDGARIDVGTRMLRGERFGQLAATSYIRIMGVGTYGQNNFRVSLELAEIVRPVSEFASTDMEDRGDGEKVDPKYRTTVLAHRDLTEGNLSIEQCRAFCEGVYNQGFLKSEKGREMVADLLGQQYPSFYEEYRNHIIPPKNMMAAFIESADRKLVLLLDGETGKLKLPMAARRDKAETLSVGLGNCFLESRSSVQDFILEFIRYYGEFKVQGLGDVFRAVSAVSCFPSDVLFQRDSDLVGVPLPKEMPWEAWEESVAARLDADSLRVIKAFRGKGKTPPENGEPQPQV